MAKDGDPRHQMATAALQGLLEGAGGAAVGGLPGLPPGVLPPGMVPPGTQMRGGKRSQAGDWLCTQCPNMSLMRRGCGSSHTLNTLDDLTNPNPSWVDWRLFSACLMSP